MSFSKQNRILFNIIWITIFILTPIFSKAQLFVGERIHIEKGVQLYVENDLILDTDEIQGEGEIVLSSDKKQLIIVRKPQIKLANISIKNKKGVEVKGVGYLLAKTISIAKESSLSGKYLGHVLYQDKTINTQTALVVTGKEKLNTNNDRIEGNFIPEILGYGFIINITEVIRKTTSKSTKGLLTASTYNVVVYNHDFINLPLINTYYTQKSSDYYYTQTYKDEDFSKIFKPPKIS